MEELSIACYCSQFLSSTRLASLRLPSLKKFSLTKVECQQEEDGIVEFLQAHPNLTALSLTMVVDTSFNDPEEFEHSLPHLESVKCSSLDPARHLLEPLSDGSYRPITLFHISDDVHIHPQLNCREVLDFQGVGRTLRDLQLDLVRGIQWQDLVLEVARTCSKLRRLSIPWWDVDRGPPSKTSFVSFLSF